MLFRVRIIAAELRSRRHARKSARPAHPAASTIACLGGYRFAADFRRVPPALLACPPTSAVRDPVLQCRSHLKSLRIRQHVLGISTEAKPEMSIEAGDGPERSIL